MDDAFVDNFERLRAYGYAPGSYFNFCGECGVQHTADKRASRCLKCAEARAAAPVMAVKGLNWREADHYLYTAGTILGMFYIAEYAGMDKPFKLDSPHVSARYFDTLEAAKAAAEADYNARILSALDTVPADLLADVRVKRLVEAAKELEKQAQKAVNLGAVTGSHWTYLGLARMKMTTALSAIEAQP